MNLGRLCIENRVLGWLIIIVFTIAGVGAFETLGRYEDPEFTIKDAKVITPYPGASPIEVEQEVTDRIESAIQQLGQVKYITSISTAGKCKGKSVFLLSWLVILDFLCNFLFNHRY